MPRETAFPSLDEAIAIHERLIETFDGPAGIRDPGLLDSALHRPRSGYYSDLVAMAAALFESLLMNRPFVDGNKRVAFFATDVFLRMNGWRIVADADEAHRFLIGLLETRTAGFDHLAASGSTSVKARNDSPSSPQAVRQSIASGACGDRGRFSLSAVPQFPRGHRNDHHAVPARAAVTDRARPPSRLRRSHRSRARPRYSSHSHFTRAFRDHFGLTPSRYRATM